jgi:hypothetical protein
MIQRQRPQETRTAQEETLWKQLAYNNADSARQTLAPLEASDALQVLVRVLARDEQKTLRQVRIIRRILMIIFCLLIVTNLIAVIHGSFKPDFGTFSTPIMLLSLILTMRDMQPVSERKKMATDLLPELVPRLKRTDISFVLELTPQAKRDDLALVSWLGHGLGRMPLDELVALSPKARQGLRLLTQEAIEKSKTEQKAEALAIAGLLALGSLKDTSLKKVAEQAVLQHTRGHVCAAAEEYLSTR